MTSVLSKASCRVVGAALDAVRGDFQAVVRL